MRDAAAYLENHKIKYKQKPICCVYMWRTEQSTWVAFNLKSKPWFRLWELQNSKFLDHFLKTSINLLPSLFTLIDYFSFLKQAVTLCCVLSLLESNKINVRASYNTEIKRAWMYKIHLKNTNTHAHYGTRCWAMNFTDRTGFYSEHRAVSHMPHSRLWKTKQVLDKIKMKCLGLRFSASIMA